MLPDVTKDAGPVFDLDRLRKTAGIGDTGDDPFDYFFRRPRVIAQIDRYRDARIAGLQVMKGKRVSASIFL